MDKVTKKRIFLSTEVNPEQKEKLELISKRNDLSISQLVRKAIDEYLNKGEIVISL